MHLTHVAQLLVLLCGLSPVQGALKMTATNETIAVEPRKGTLGSKYQMSKMSSMSISCRLTDTTPLSSPSISWHPTINTEANAAVTETVSSDQQSFESRLTVQRPQDENVTSYVCAGKSGSQSVNATAAFKSVPLLSIAVSGGGSVYSRWVMVEYPDLDIKPGVPATVTCKVFGYPAGVARWLRVDARGNEISIGTGPKLELNGSSYENDRGFYVCRSKNSMGRNSLRIFLRVKNPKAYVTPLIFLILLVVISMVIYITYELKMLGKRQRAVREIDGDAKVD